MFFRTCMLTHIILYCWGEQKARGWFLQFLGWAMGGTVRPPSDKSRRWSGFRVGEETASVWTHRIWTVGYRHIVQMGSWRLWRDLDLLARRGQVIGEPAWGGDELRRGAWRTRRDRPGRVPWHTGPVIKDGASASDWIEFEVGAQGILWPPSWGRRSRTIASVPFSGMQTAVLVSWSCEDSTSWLAHGFQEGITTQ